MREEGVGVDAAPAIRSARVWHVVTRIWAVTECQIVVVFDRATAATRRWSALSLESLGSRHCR